MAEAMLRVARDEGLALRLGRAASEAIHTHPLISRHVEILQETIQECLSSR
jgi:hypothetical protein